MMSEDFRRRLEESRRKQALMHQKTLDDQNKKAREQEEAARRADEQRRKAITENDIFAERFFVEVDVVSYLELVKEELKQRFGVLANITGRHDAKLTWSRSGTTGSGGDPPETYTIGFSARRSGYALTTEWTRPRKVFGLSFSEIRYGAPRVHALDIFIGLRSDEGMIPYSKYGALKYVGKRDLDSYLWRYERSNMYQRGLEYPLVLPYRNSLLELIQDTSFFKKARTHTEYIFNEIAREAFD